MIRLIVKGYAEVLDKAEQLLSSILRQHQICCRGDDFGRKALLAGQNRGPLPSRGDRNGWLDRFEGAIEGTGQWIRRRASWLVLVVRLQV